MKKIILLLGILLVLPTLIFSQTIINYQTSNRYLSNKALGQSFTATVDGFITQIDVLPGYDLSNTNLLIYATGNGSGSSDVRGTPDYEQSGVNLTSVGNGSADWNNITLSTPFPIIAGQQYSFIIEGNGVVNPSLNYTLDDPYSGGAMIRSYGKAMSYNDLNFRVWESAPTPTPIRIWPFITLFAILAVFTIVRRIR